MADSYGTYVLEMGRPVKIVDLARKMIELLGAKDDVEIQFVGLRPGERLHEALFEEGERLDPTAHPAISRLVPESPPRPDFLGISEEMTYYSREGDDEKVLTLLRYSVPSYPAFDTPVKGA